MKWISVKDKLPEDPGEILVAIEDCFFLGVVNRAGKTSPYTLLKEIPVYEIGTGWLLPLHFKEPSYWMYIEEPCQEV